MDTIGFAVWPTIAGVGKMNFDPLAGGFLLLTAIMGGGIVVGLRRAGGSQWAMLALAGWLLLVGGLAKAGVVAQKMPPGPLLVAAPAILYVVFGVARNPSSAAFASKIALPALIGAQTFRLFVEIGFHQLAQRGWLPERMTFEGRNWDIVIGLTAPVVALVAVARPDWRRAYQAWNLLGLALVINAMAQAMISFAGHGTESMAIGRFPFAYVPGFLAPLAVALHVLTFKALAAPRLGAVALTSSGN